MHRGTTNASEALASAIRIDSVRLTSAAASSHVGSALSCADILAVLYTLVLQHRPDEPDWPERDRLIFSKGHAAVSLYSALARVGYFDSEQLHEFGSIGTEFAGHVTAGRIPGIEVSSGSLGHGLPIATGAALALVAAAPEARVFCLMSDGECQEGSIWEAALLARHWRLRNLHVIVDANGQQGLGPVTTVAGLEPLTAKWEAFGWDVREVDGHDLEALADSLQRSHDFAPIVTIARTVKGRGVSFMENRVDWHYRSASGSELDDALRELGAT